MENGELKISRNAPCPCGSGKKYKLCCGAKAVAEERAAEERKSPFYRPKVERPKIEVPEGVTVEQDDTHTGWPNGRPKWRMELDVCDDDEVERIVNKLVRPYFDRYCEMTGFEEDDRFEIAVMEAAGYHDQQLGTSPSVILGRYDQLWDILCYKIDDILGCCCSDRNYSCEIRWDRMYGGPVITVDGGTDIASLFIAKPDRWDKMSEDEEDCQDNESEDERE